MAGNIQTFQSDVKIPTADNAGSEAYEIEGRHIEGAFAQAGQAIGQGIGRVGNAVENHYEIQDTSQNLKDSAQLLADQSKQISDTMQTADPNDADQVADNLRDQMTAKVADLGQGNVTRAGQEQAQRMQSQLTDQLSTKISAYHSVLSGQAVTQNLDQTVATLNQAVANDPTSWRSAADLLTGGLKDQLATHKDLSPEELNRVHDEFGVPAVQKLAATAFQSLAEKNPQGALDSLSKGDFSDVFSAEDIKQAQGYANTQLRAQTEAQKAAATQLKEQQTAAFKATTSGLVASMMRPDGSLQVPPGVPQEIVKSALMPGAEPGEVRSMMDMVKSINTENAKGVKAVTDPSTYSMFNQKLLSGQLDDAQIYQARAAGQLSDHDTSYFIAAQKNLAADPVRKSAMKDFANFAIGQKPAFTHGSGQISVDPATGSITMGSSDPVGAQNYADFYRDAQQRYSDAYTRDPKEAAAMLDPKSPSYVGRLAPQYLNNKKSADFNTGGTGARTTPNQLTEKEVDGYVSDPKNKGKWFTVPSMPGKRMQVP